MTDQANKPTRRDFLEKVIGAGTAVVGGGLVANAAQITGGTVDSLPAAERAKVLAGEQAAQPAAAELAQGQAAAEPTLEQVAELRKAAAGTLMTTGGIGLRALPDEQREALKLNLSDNNKDIYFVPSPQNAGVGLVVYQARDNKDESKNLRVVFKNISSPYNGVFVAGHLQQMKANHVGVMRGEEVVTGLSTLTAYGQAEGFMNDLIKQQSGQRQGIPGVPQVPNVPNPVDDLKRTKDRIKGIFGR